MSIEVADVAVVVAVVDVVVADPEIVYFLFTNSYFVFFKSSRNRFLKKFQVQTWERSNFQIGLYLIRLAKLT